MPPGRGGSHLIGTCTSGVSDTAAAMLLARHAAASDADNVAAATAATAAAAATAPAARLSGDASGAVRRPVVIAMDKEKCKSFSWGPDSGHGDWIAVAEHPPDTVPAAVQAAVAEEGGS